jgi:hypothetical protein
MSPPSSPVPVQRWASPPSSPVQFDSQVMQRLLSTTSPWIVIVGKVRVIANPLCLTMVPRMVGHRPVIYLWFNCWASDLQELIGAPVGNCFRFLSSHRSLGELTVRGIASTVTTAWTKRRPPALWCSLISCTVLLITLWSCLPPFNIWL